MNSLQKTKSFSQEGYLNENYHYFHLKDTAGQERSFHFHEFDKVVLLLSGKVDYIVENMTCSLQPWSVLLVGHHAIHKAIIDVSAPYERVILYLDRKYFSPLLRSRSLTFLHIKPDTERRIRLIGYILQLLDVLREEPRGYELAVRQILGDFLILLSEEAAEILARDQAGNERDLERMKLMLDYVYKNYGDQIGVTEIAQAAGISSRECTRCFKRTVDRTPVRFLIEYRAQMAASLLLGTGMSVSEIAEKCGFMSDSYFSKIFREIYKCTPREYRKEIT